MRSWLSRLILGLGAAALMGPAVATAHPLGNFSISQYSAIRIGADGIALRYLVDMAEIPTFQEMQEHGIPADPVDPRVRGYLRRKAEALQHGLVLDIEGRPLSLEVKSAEVIFPAGVGDLPTLKLAILYRAAFTRSTAGTAELRYRDENFPGRAGWKEVIAQAEADTRVLERSVPDRDRSRELADYPTDLLDSPPQVRQARLVFTPAPAAPLATWPSRSEAAMLAPQPSARGAPRDAFADLVATKDLGTGVVLLALAVAAALGAFHALEPGHGKTVVAAYLVGSRGTTRHALILGLLVTASHTAGVYLLGGVTFYASQYVLPERLYPWLGLVSGLTIALLGGSLVVRRSAGVSNPRGRAHRHGTLTHSHGPGVVHDHTPHRDHDHAHGHGHHHHAPASAVSPRGLLALGITSGIIPCPAALVVLLSALSLGRVGLGLLLIVAFSVGLAIVLITVGVLMVSARRFLARLDEGGMLITRWLPLASAAVMTLVGVAIALQALMSAGLG